MLTDLDLALLHPLIITCHNTTCNSASMLLNASTGSLTPNSTQDTTTDFARHQPPARNLSKLSPIESSPLDNSNLASGIQSLNSKSRAMIDLEFPEMEIREGCERDGSPPAGYKLFDGK
jgi:hypothetical protein